MLIVAAARPTRPVALVEASAPTLAVGSSWRVRPPVAEPGCTSGHGHVVTVPEIFHELEAEPGTVLAYDQAGADRGNAHKTTKQLASYDADARATLDFLAAHEACSGQLGTMGICIGGHLAFRAAMNPDARDRLLLRHRHPQVRPR